MAYVLGFFAADGSMYKTRRGAHFIEFQITDKQLLGSIRKAVSSNHKISIRRPTRTSWKTSYRLQLGSKDIYKDLLYLGMTPTKSKTLPFPIIPAKYLSDFVRGYFDGDGCAHLGCYWRKDRNSWSWRFITSFASGSKRFLEGLWLALRPHVRRGRLGEKEGGYELVFSQQDSFALFRLMYNNVPAAMFLERKYRVFLRASKILNAGVV